MGTTGEDRGLVPAEPVKLSAKLEQALVEGDLKNLTPSERVEFYNRTCESLGLNPLTRPFGYIVLNGKLTLYAQKACTDDLRKLHGVSITEIREENDGDVYKVWATARDRTGRTDCDLGAVPLGKLQGDALANAKMKAITKAKRRVTLSICGLGWLDETEVTTIPGARQVGADEPAPPPLVRARRIDQGGNDGSKPNPDSAGVSPAARGGDGGARVARPRTTPAPERAAPVATGAAGENPRPLELSPAENAKLDRELAAEDQGGLFTGDPAAELRDAKEPSPSAFITDEQIGHLMKVCRDNGVSEDALKVKLENTWGITSRKRIPRVLYEALLQSVERTTAAPKARIAYRRPGRRS